MDPPAKIKLVESLCKILESVGVLGTSSNQVTLTAGSIHTCTCICIHISMRIINNNCIVF